MQDAAGAAAAAPLPFERWQEDFSTIYRSGLFDHTWYAARYPDVVLTDLPPLEHYVKYGARLGRQPSPDFTAEPCEAADGTFDNPLAASIRLDRASRADRDPDAPVVSVLCTTFNHARFIRETLDGLVGQVTDFPFEVLVGDDCSTDGTAAIIAEYAARHANLIAVLRPRNLGSIRNFSDLAARARGEFVAFCEGDDYWTDLDKLQVQVDFLKARPEYTLCFHPVRVIYDDAPGREDLFPESCAPQPALSDLATRNIIQTNSVLYRWRYGGREALRFDEGIAPGDWYLHLMHAEVGRIGFIPRVMAVYRKHAGGMWAGHASEIARHRRLGGAEIELFRQLRGHFGGRFAASFEASQRMIFRRLAEACLDDEDVPGLRSVIEAHPDIARDALDEMGFDGGRLPTGEADVLRTWLEEHLTVSVIVTAFGHAADIGRCLEGVLSQRGLFKLRVIVTGDRALDGFAEAIDTHRARFPNRIEVRRAPPDHGMLRGLKDCIAICGSRYVAFCDAGDHWISDRKIARQLRVLRADPKRDLCFNWVLLHDVMAGTYLPHEEQGRFATGPVGFPGLADAPVTADLSCCLYRTEALKRLPDSVYETTDGGAWLMSLRVADRGRVAFLREILSTHTVRTPGQVSGFPDAARDARVDQCRRRFADMFGAGRGFEPSEVRCTVAELDGPLPNAFARAHLETPHDGGGVEIEDRQVVLAGWVVPTRGAEATLVAEVDGERQRVPIDVRRPDVIAAVLGGAPTAVHDARCGFRFALPYGLALAVRLLIEIERDVVPWLSIGVSTHVGPGADAGPGSTTAPAGVPDAEG